MQLVKEVLDLQNFYRMKRKKHQLGTKCYRTLKTNRAYFLKKPREIAYLIGNNNLNNRQLEIK